MAFLFGVERVLGMYLSYEGTRQLVCTTGGDGGRPCSCPRRAATPLSERRPAPLRTSLTFARAAPPPPRALGPTGHAPTQTS